MDALRAIQTFFQVIAFQLCRGQQEDVLFEANYRLRIPVRNPLKTGRDLGKALQTHRNDRDGFDLDQGSVLNQ